MASPPSGPQPPPPPPPARPAGSTTTSATTVRTGPGVPQGPNPVLMLVIGLIVGLLLGLGIGYLLWHGSKTSSASAVASPTPTASPTPLPAESVSPAPTATAPPATATAAPVTAAQGIAPCPVATPAGQHALGTPAGPGAGQHRVASLDFCGRGSAVLPAGTSRFTTGNNWGLGIADSCPPGSSGPTGMGNVLTVTEVRPDSSPGPDTASEQGDWVNEGGVNMSSGGNYQLNVSTVSPKCVWHIAIYPS